MSSLAANALPILVVDDDSALIRTLADILRLHGYAPSTAATGAQGLDIATHLKNPLALALVDLRLPDMDGLELVARLRDLSDLTQVVVLTGNASLDSAVAAMRSQSFDYLVKPVAVEQLLKTVAFAGERWQRRQAEDALRRTNERFRRLFEAVSEGVAVVDRGGIVQYASPSVGRLSGQPVADRASRPIWELLRAEDPAPLRGAIEAATQGTGPRSIESRIRRVDGTAALLEIVSTAFPEPDGQDRVILTARDITERRQLEEQFRQAQKMEAVGRLAGGVAHDFNNLLTVVLSTCDLLAGELDPGDPRLADLEDIRLAGERAAGLTRQLLTFSRQQVVEPRIIDLGEVVRNLDKMLRRLIGEDVELRTVARGPVGSVKADIGQVEQVVVNLVVNARDALPDGGKLTIEITDFDLTEPHDTDQVEVPAGRYVMLAVSDNGSGMSAETKARLFEPFFTTKAPGKGTGLGLATVYGIVKQCGGFIWVYSELGAGTTFKILLPRVEEVAASRASAPTPQILEGSETVLLVEDNEAVRGAARRALEAYGYRVLAAGTAEDVARQLNEVSGRVDLLVTDVVMPGTSGRLLAEQLQTQHPHLKVLFVSGYTDDAVVQHGVLKSGTPFLQKPFTGPALVRKVREVLDA